MKIAIDCRMKHGVETVVKNVAPILAEEAEVVALGDPNRFLQWWGSTSNVRQVNFSAPIYGVKEQLQFPYRAIRDCQVLHIPHFNIPIGRVRCPVVVTINDVGHLAGVLPISRGHKFTARVYYEHAVRRANHIVTLSAFSKKEIVERLDVDPEKITVIPCGVDRSRFHPASESEIVRVTARLNIRKPYLLIVGSVRPHKNVGRVLKAFVELKQEYRIPHQLVVVGEREGFRIHTELPAIPDDIASDIVFTGFIDETELISLYSGSDVFIFGSIYEGFGLPPLEAMACGAPVAASNAASLPEVVGDAGVYFDPFDVEKIAQAVYSLLDNHEKRYSCIQASLERAKEFSWRESAAQYMQVYKRLVGVRT